MKKQLLATCLTLVLLLWIPSAALAQDLSFSLDEQTVHVIMQPDGTVAIDYVLVFSNDPGAPPIDFVDVGFPNRSYSLRNVSAEVDGRPITDIEDSPYFDYGVALGLGANAIQPGQTGQVHVFVSDIGDMFFTDNTDDSYATLQFVPVYFGSEFVHGDSDLTVVFHFPPGLSPEEPRWSAAPSGFPSEPEAGFDDQGRIFYAWRNPSARADREYKFGASLPKSYLPSSAVSGQTTLPAVSAASISLDEFIPFLFCCGVGLFILITGGIGVASSNRRKLQYLPPKVSIGGHGVKRGLTAVEAAVMLETPMDKILTMILFATLKKEAATVQSRDPLVLEVADPLPEGLRTYEAEFLEAFRTKEERKRRVALQDMMIGLVKSVAHKMKGFSKKETVSYYRDIMERAWAQVDAAGTPEVKSQAFDEHMEWTMLDDDFDRRTRDIFREGPVFVPVWWGRFDPGYSGGAAAGPVSSAPSSTGGRGLSLPTLPGASFAAGVANSIQNFSAGVVGNVAEFTGGVTAKTNPPPPPSTRSSGGRSGGGSSCACACAGCACACACAGGGR